MNLAIRKSNCDCRLFGASHHDAFDQCLATDAGGTRELVDDSTGHLLPVECTDEEVLAALKALADRLSQREERAALQQASFDTWDNLCDKEKNYRDFFETLDALTEQGLKLEV